MTARFDGAKLVHLFVAALFVASVVHVLQPWLVPLEVAARTAVANRAATGLAPTPSIKPEVAVLEIDREHFLRAHGGRLPLDRCRLHRDIENALSRLPQVREVGIDLDLSPLPESRPADVADPMTADVARANARQNECGRALLRWLAEWADASPGRRVALILPPGEEDRKQSGTWRESVPRPLRLADARVVREFGIVRAHWLNKDACPTLGQAFADPGDSHAVCRHAERDLDELNGNRNAERNISFHRAIESLRVPPVSAGWEQQLTLLAQEAGALRRVFIGARFDSSDDFITPVGVLSGVQVHAAISLNPDETSKHWLGFLLDLVCGVGLGSLFTSLWYRYFRARAARPSDRCSECAYFWLISLIIVWAAAFYVLSLSSEFLLEHFDLWLSPMPMLVGMTLDAFVLGSVEVSTELIEDSRREPHDAGHGREPITQSAHGGSGEAAEAWPAPIPWVWRSVLGRRHDGRASPMDRVCVSLRAFVWWSTVAVAVSQLIH